MSAADLLILKLGYDAGIYGAADRWPKEPAGQLELNPSLLWLRGYTAGFKERQRLKGQKN